MDEEKETKGEGAKEDAPKESEGTNENSNNGKTSEKPSMVDEAEKAAGLMKIENDRKEELLKREEELQAKKILGGKSEAGSVEEKKEETPKEYKDKVMANDLE